MSSNRLNLKLLGGATVTWEDGEPVAIPTRKALGLLAYLAMQAGRDSTREALSNLYWADTPAQRARSSLRRTLHELTDALGSKCDRLITTRRDAIALKPDRVMVDALEFEAASRADDLVSLRRAEGLYKGRLLSGFIGDSEEFDAWQTTEAMRLEDRALQVFSKLSERALQAGRMADALSTSLRMLEADPLHEQACRLQMRALAASGRRSEALRRFESFARRLADELQTEPEQETTALYEHMCRGEAVSPGSPLKEPDVPSIVVLPVRDNGVDDDHAFLCDALTENLTAALSRDRSLFVIARNSAEVYRDTRLNASEIAADLGIRYLLFSGVQLDGKQIRVNVQLVRGSDGGHVWAEVYDRTLDALFEMQDDIVGRIVASLRGYKGVLHRAELKESHARPAAELSTYRKLMRGMEHKEKFLRDEMLIARGYFEQAAAESPEFAMAHAWLAWTWFFDVYMGWVDDVERSLEKSFESAREAVRLDPSLDFAQWALGAAYLAAGDHAASLQCFDEALRLNPNNSDALANTAWPLTFTGREGEAVDNIETAMRLNPYYPGWYLWGLGIAEYSRNNFQSTVKALGRMSRPNGQSLAYLASAALRSGDAHSASEAAGELMRLEPGFRVEQLVRSLPYIDRRIPQRLAADLAELRLH